MTDPELFRPEAALDRRLGLTGEVIISQPLMHRLLTLSIFIIMLVIAVVITTANYARTESAPGVLVTDNPSPRLFAPAEGTLSELRVEEGAEVRRGDIVAVVDLDRRDKTGQYIAENTANTVKERVRLAKIQMTIARQRTNAEMKRLKAIVYDNTRKLGKLRDQLQLQQQITISSRSIFDSLQGLLEKGYVSKNAFEQRRQGLLQSEREYHIIEQQIIALESDIKNARSALSEVGIDRARSEADSMIAMEALSEQNIHLRSEQSYAIVSPIDGYVTAIQSGVGQNVRREVPVLVVIPKFTRLYARLFVPTRAIGFMHSGEEVRLLFDAFPYERFGTSKGIINSISRTTIAPNELGLPIKVDGPVYQINVNLEKQDVFAFGRRVSLQSGMTLEASIVLERQTFLDWLLSPIRAVKRRNGI